MGAGERLKRRKLCVKEGDKERMKVVVRGGESLRCVVCFVLHARQLEWERGWEREREKGRVIVWLGERQRHDRETGKD